MSGTDELTTLLTADIMPPSYSWYLLVFDNFDINVKQCCRIFEEGPYLPLFAPCTFRLLKNLLRHYAMCFICVKPQ